MSLLFVGIAVAAWLWSVTNGQFEDLDKAASSILFEESESGARTATSEDSARNPPQ